jgi:hypothetical protein
VYHVPGSSGVAVLFRSFTTPGDIFVSIIHIYGIIIAGLNGEMRDMTHILVVKPVGKTTLNK